MARPSRSALKPRKRPLQARSQETVRVILEAAVRVLSKESLAGFNTNRVAEVAGVSVGSLYQYFPNKESLVTALSEEAQRSLVESMRALAERIGYAPLEEKLAALADFAIEQQFSNPQFAAALDHEEERLPIKRMLAQSGAQLRDIGLALLRPDLPDITEEEVADLFIIAKALVESQADGRAQAPAAIRARLLRALRGYLGLAAEEKPMLRKETARVR
jgi:AcrR family transcriptional regulator